MGTWMWFGHLGGEGLTPCLHQVLIVTESLNAYRETGDRYQLRAYTRDTRRWKTRCSGPSIDRGLYPARDLVHLTPGARICGTCWRRHALELEADLAALDLEIEP